MKWIVLLLLITGCDTAHKVALECQKQMGRMVESCKCPTPKRCPTLRDEIINCREALVLESDDCEIEEVFAICNPDATLKNYK